MKNITSGKMTSKKGGYRGSEMWTAPRLEGAVKNKSIKMTKKPKAAKKISCNLNKKITHMI